MPVISFVSPKGGVGKTTSAVLLATQLARAAKVVIIDADPNRPVAMWAKLNGCPENLRVVSDVTQENIFDQIDQAAGEVPFVVVDCEGTASLTVAYAISASDLVVVPTQGSQLDASQAARALNLVKTAEKQARRQIIHAVLVTRSNPAIRPRTLSHIQQQLAQHGVRMFQTQMHEREAFRAMFSFGGALESLDPAQVPGIEKATANAQSFMGEVIAMLREAKDATEAA